MLCDEGAIARDRECAPGVAIARLRRVEGRVADAPHLREEREIRTELGRRAARCDALCAVRRAIASRRGELEECDADHRLQVLRIIAMA